MVDKVSLFRSTGTTKTDSIQKQTQAPPKKTSKPNCVFNLKPEKKTEKTNDISHTTTLGTVQIEGEETPL